jgi:hypothetical protein
VVREISTQTAEGSTATSTSIAKLAALSAQLRKSVAGFRLPDYGGGTTTVGASSSRLRALSEPASAANPGSTNGSGAPAAIAPAAGGGAPVNAGGMGASNNSSAGNSGKIRKASGFGG